MGPAERAGDYPRDGLAAQRLSRPRSLGTAKVVELSVGLALGKSITVPLRLAMAQKVELVVKGHAKVSLVAAMTAMILDSGARLHGGGENETGYCANA
jgi:hypothetical protein